MVSVQKIMGSVGLENTAYLKRFAPMAAVPKPETQKLSVLSGASGGPNWQFAEVPPIGVNIKDYHDSVDNNIFEILGGTLERTADAIAPEGAEAAREAVTEHMDKAKDILGEWGDQIIEVLSEIL